jgi:hypothetical protein
MKKMNTPEDGKPSDAHGLAQLILSKWLYCQKQFADSVQSPSKSQQHSS